VNIENIFNSINYNECRKKKVSKQKPNTYRTEPFSFKSIKKIKYNDLSICSQLTISRLEYLLKLSIQYKGKNLILKFIKKGKKLFLKFIKKRYKKLFLNFIKKRYKKN
jgi:hypothetical protein